MLYYLIVFLVVFSGLKVDSKHNPTNRVGQIRGKLNNCGETNNAKINSLLPYHLPFISEKMAKSDDVAYKAFEEEMKNRFVVKKSYH